MKNQPNTPKQVPYYLRPDRNRTDPAVAAAYRDKGWSWNGKHVSELREKVLAQ